MNAEVGLQPLQAVGSIYEPEAVGAIGAYAPEGMRKSEKKEKHRAMGIGQNVVNSEGGILKAGKKKIRFAVFCEKFNIDGFVKSQNFDFCSL